MLFLSLLQSVINYKPPVVRTWAGFCKLGVLKNWTCLFINPNPQWGRYEINYLPKREGRESGKKKVQSAP